MQNTNLKTRILRRLLLTGACVAVAYFTASARAEWKNTFSLHLEGGYDSSVYLQDETALGDQDSFIGVIQPGIDLGWETRPFNVHLIYQPRISIFGSEPDETNCAHLANLNFKGALGDSVTYEFSNAFDYIQGTSETPTYTGEGGLPAIAAYQVRDRHEAFWMKQNARLTWTIGSFFLRPVYSGYLHDFRTDLLPIRGHANYVDRNQFVGGLDLGVKILPETFLVAGYRCGSMNQAHLFGEALEYSNTFQRALLGIEGRPVKWLKVSTLVGPSFHRFDYTVPPVFGRNHTRVFADANVSIMPTSKDTIDLTLTRFEFLSSCGRGAYEDITYRAGYTRQLTDSVKVKADFRLYRAEFEAPALREDNIYSPSVQLSWKLNSHLTCGAQYTYEWAESDIPATWGREYHHHLASISADYTF